MTGRPTQCLLLLLLSVCVGAASGQTVARKGWVGSGLSVDPWWKGAVFYQLNPRTFQDSDGDGTGDLNGVEEHLDYLQQLGVDAIVLSPLVPREPRPADGSSFEAVYGKEEDFDKLQQEASLRRMRVIVDLPLGAKRSTADTLAMARFWLSRGVGGFLLSNDGNAGDAIGQADAADRVRQLRKLCEGYVGDRVLLWDVAGSATPQDQARAGSSRRRQIASDQPQLTVDRAVAFVNNWNANTMRSLASGTQRPNAVGVSDAPNEVRSWTRLSPGADDAQRLAIAKMVATLMLTGREAPMLFYGQEIGMASDEAKLAPMQWGGNRGMELGPNASSATVAAEDAAPSSLLNWYRKLSGLRQQGLALKAGTLTLVDTGYPDVVAWVRKGTTAGERPVLVVCNLSGHGVLISVEQQLKALGLKPTSGMVPLALSFTGTNPSYTATGIDLPAYGTYLGEILQPGLEDAPAPYVSHRRGR